MSPGNGEVDRPLGGVGCLTLDATMALGTGWSWGSRWCEGEGHSASGVAGDRSMQGPGCRGAGWPVVWWVLLGTVGHISKSCW